MRGAIAVSLLGLLLVAGLLALAAKTEADEFTVAITDSGFVPEVITVPIRSVVVWTNVGSMSRTVTALNGEFSSGVLATGGVYSYTFAAPGEYPYRDLFSSVTGKVVVGEGVHRVFLPLVMQNHQ